MDWCVSMLSGRIHATDRLPSLADPRAFFTDRSISRKDVCIADWSVSIVEQNWSTSDESESVSAVERSINLPSGRANEVGASIPRVRPCAKQSKRSFPAIGESPEKKRFP